MTREHQVVFVLDLVHRIRSDVVQLIDDGKIPEEWDGHELRHLLADKFAESATYSRHMRDKRAKRRRDYENVKLINNL